MPEFTRSDLLVRAQRVQQRLILIGDITGEIIDRPGWSAAETAAHELVGGWMRDAGMQIHTDAAGNLHGVTPGQASERPQVWSGSHLDTVPAGGRYDGALGVLVALEAAELIGPRPVSTAVIAWRDEEGTRFGLGCNGARASVGRLSAAQLALTDADGISLAEAMASAGATVTDEWVESPPAAYVESHIEQGVILSGAGRSTAVVTGAVARVRLDVRVDGVAGHAAVPLRQRRDAGVVAARLILDVRELAEAQPQAVATVGGLTLTPGARNVVPERADLYLDMRAPDDATLAAMLAEFHARARVAGDVHGCTVSTVVRQHEPAVSFDPELLDLLRAELPPGAPELVSWGGHDALILAKAGVPTAMLYVASANDGAAHSILEYTETAVVADAVGVIARALITVTAAVERSGGQTVNL